MVGVLSLASCFTPFVVQSFDPELVIILISMVSCNSGRLSPSSMYYYYFYHI